MTNETPVAAQATEAAEGMPSAAASVPRNLKQVRGYAIFILIIVPLFAILAATLKLGNQLLIGLAFAEVIHLTLLLAVIKRSKILFWISSIIFALLALFDVVIVIAGSADVDLVVRLIIEVYVVVSFWKNKKYFSA